LQKRTSDTVFNLQHIEGVNETLAQAIYQAGFLNVRQVSDAPVEALQKIPGYDVPETAAKLKERAAAVVRNQAMFLPEPQALAMTKEPSAPLQQKTLKQMQKQDCARCSVKQAMTAQTTAKILVTGKTRM